MIGREILRGVWDTLRANRLRFLLTLSGVVVGSASLVLLSGLLAGGREALAGAANEAGEQDLIEVSEQEPPEKQQRRTTRPLERGDGEVLAGSALLERARVVGQRSYGVTATYRDEAQEVQVVGVDLDALELYRLELARGRFLRPDDLAERRRVAVVGHEVAKQLLGGGAGGGNFQEVEIRVGGDRLRVVGVLAHKPSFAPPGPWQWDGRVLVPDPTVQVLVPRGPGDDQKLDRIFVRLAEVTGLAERLPQVRAVVRATLLRRHHGVENFEVSGKNAEAESNMFLEVVSMLVLATAGISLTVGGINVMNIMLVSVTERTREIGIRRTVGATRGRILAQFLAESVVTATLGGLLGVALGAALTLLASTILDSVTGAWSFRLAPWAPPLSLGTAMFVGAAFGVYPAWRASRLDPAAALRFE